MKHWYDRNIAEKIGEYTYKIELDQNMWVYYCIDN